MTSCVWTLRLLTVLSACWAVHVFADVIIRIPQGPTTTNLVDIVFSEDLFAKYYACLFANDTKLTCEAKTTYDVGSYTVSDISSKEENLPLNKRIVTCRNTLQLNGVKLACTRADDNVDLSQGDVTYFRPFDASTCSNSSLCAGILWSTGGSLNLTGSTNFEYCTDSCEETTVRTSTLPVITTTTTTATTTTTTQPITTPSPTAPTPSSGRSTSTASPESLVSPTTNIPDTSTTNSHTNATATGDNVSDDDDGDVDEEVIYIIVGTICGLLVLIIIIVVIVVCVRRQRRRDSKRIAQTREDAAADPGFMFENKVFAADVEFVSTDFRSNSFRDADTVDKDVAQMYPKVNENAGNSKPPNNVILSSNTQGREANNGQTATKFDTVISPGEQSAVSDDNTSDNNQFLNHIYNVSADDNIDNKNNDELAPSQISQNDVESNKSNVFDTEIVNDHVIVGDMHQPVLSPDSRLSPTLVYSNTDDDMLSPGQGIKGDYSEPDEPPVYATVNKGKNRDHDLMITVL